MSRIDAPDIYDPFAWRLSDLVSPATAPGRRETILEELLVWEAEEAAHGYRHLTIIHDDPRELAAVRLLADFYETLRSVASGCDWVRARGDFSYVTVTVRGDGADERIAEFERAVQAANPGSWTVIASAFPPVT